MSFSLETEDKIQKLGSKVIDAASKVHAYAVAGSSLYIPTVEAVDAFSAAPTSGAIGFIAYSAAAYLIPKLTTGMGPYEILQNYVSRNPIKILDMAEAKRKVTPIVRDDMGLDPLDRTPLNYILKRSKLMTSKEKASLFNLLEKRALNNSLDKGETFFPELKNQLIQMVESSYSPMDRLEKSEWKKAIDLSRSREFPKWEREGQTKEDLETVSNKSLAGTYVQKMKNISSQEDELSKARNLISDAVSMFPKKHANRYPSLHHKIAFEAGSIIPPSFLLKKLVNEENAAVRKHVVEALNGTGELNAENIGVSKDELLSVTKGFEKVLAYPALFSIEDNKSGTAINAISNQFASTKQTARDAFLERTIGQESQAVSEIGLEK